MNPFVVYTAITRDYDLLKSPPPQWRHQADFVAFLDAPQPDSRWSFRPIYRRFRDPCRNAKIHKILPHRYFPEAKYSLWVDGAVRITSTLALDQWADEYLKRHDLAVFKHRCRTCIYQEGAYCLHLGRDAPEVINCQMQKYFDEGYPAVNGLADCTILLRRHTKKIEQFNEMWYQEIKTHSRRDQLSFNYVARKIGLKYSHFPGLLGNSQHFTWSGHTGPRSQPK